MEGHGDGLVQGGTVNATSERGSLLSLDSKMEGAVTGGSWIASNATPRKAREEAVTLLDWPNCSPRMRRRRSL
jgi:hypothetical protein